MVSRLLGSIFKSKRKSVLLLGARQVGKSTLIRSLKPDLSINLADLEVFFQLTSNPAELRNRIDETQAQTIFIDEVQKYSALLNTVQALCDENKKLKFYLTGSSARKLKRGRANLLPGRVLSFQMGGLTSCELGYKANQDRLLSFGTLPEIYLSNNLDLKKQLLRSYTTTYLQEEIRSETVVRNIDSFSRSLPFALLNSGKFIDYSKVAKQAKVSRHSLARFYEIFEDTLIGTRLWPDEFLKEKADLVKHPKFFVFDTGIYNVFAGSFELSTDRKGILFEHLIFNQLLHSSWAKNKLAKVSTFRSRGGLEVDFILDLEGSRFAIEAKSSTEMSPNDVSSLLKVKTLYDPQITVVGAHLGSKSKKVAGVWCHPWQILLKEIGL